MACPYSEKLADYMSQSPRLTLPPQVVLKTKLHVLDTLAAVLSGSRLKPGEFAARFVQELGGRPEATILGTPQVTSAVNAALANAMAAHADETDDSHLKSRSHLGCAVVPAAQREDRRIVHARFVVRARKCERAVGKRDRQEMLQADIGNVSIADDVQAVVGHGHDHALDIRCG